MVVLCPDIKIDAFVKKEPDGDAIRQKITRLSPVFLAQRAYIIDPPRQAMIFGVIPKNEIKYSISL
jgi:hypothetical protein